MDESMCPSIAGDKNCKNQQKTNDGHDEEPVECRDICEGPDQSLSAPPVGTSVPHFSPELNQTLVRKLLKNSEDHAVRDILLAEKINYDDWGEAVTGWNSIVPYANYAPKDNCRQKSESAVKKNVKAERITLHCSGIDLNLNAPVSPWKAYVEPVTHRYIPNNGIYRHTKVSKEVQKWLAKNKRISYQVKVNPEIRQAQKSLIRDLESHLNTGAVKEILSPIHDPTLNSCSYAADKSTALGIPQHFPASELKMVKSSSDLLLENFNSRLKPLENEIHTAASSVHDREKISEKSMTGVIQTVGAATKKPKEIKGLDTLKAAMQASSQHNGREIGDDLFTITPVFRAEMPLGRLEKLTPKLKSIHKHQILEKSASPAGEAKTILTLDSMQCQSAQLIQAHAAPKDSFGAVPVQSTVSLAEKLRPFRPTEQSLPFSSELRDMSKSYFLKKGHTGSHQVRQTAVRYRDAAANFRSSVPESNLLSVDDDVASEELGNQVGQHRNSELRPVQEALPEILGKRLPVVAFTNRLL